MSIRLVDNHVGVNEVKKEGKVIEMFETLGNNIENFLLECKKKSKSTYINYKSDINVLAKHLFDREQYSHIRKSDIEGTSVEELVQYFNACYQEEEIDGSRKYSNNTISRRISSLKSLIKFLAERRIIKYNLVDLHLFLKAFPDKAIMIDVLSDEDAKRCLEQFKTFPMGNVMYRLGKLGLETALRANELLTLEWNQFTVMKDKVMINSRGENKGKGNKNWEHEISLNIYNELLELKEENNPKVFNISYSTIAKYMTVTIKTLGLTDKKYTFHSLRKTSVTYTYNITGGDIIAAKEKANHSSIDTTTRYIKPNRYGATGMFSVEENYDKESYRKVTHEELISAIEQLDDSYKFLLNKAIAKINSKW